MRLDSKGCVFQNMEPPESLSISRKGTKVLGSIRRVRFTIATQRHANIRETRVRRWEKFKSRVPHRRSPYVLTFEDRSQEETQTQRVFLVIRPNPIMHFAEFLSTHFFPCWNPIFKNGSFLSVVALVSVTLLDSNPRPSSEKRSNLAPTPSSSLAQTTTIELPECQERRGAKTI